MIGLVINPGSGPVADATHEQARACLDVLLDDLRRCVGKKLRFKVRRASRKDYGDGRFAFLVTRGKKTVELQVPGLPVERVRYAKSLGHDPWQFPRLYVDGSSWLWEFAVRILLDQFGFKDVYEAMRQGEIHLEALS